MSQAGRATAVFMKGEAFGRERNVIIPQDPQRSLLSATIHLQFSHAQFFVPL